MEREEGERQLSAAVQRKDGCRPGAVEHSRDSRVGFENGCGHGGDSRREMGATSGLSGGVRPFGRVEADQR